MTDLRTAAQQALEALEVATNCLDGYYIPRGKTTLPEIEDAITALRAALAEPVQEPYAWMAVGGTIWRHKTSEDDVPLYTAPRVPLAEWQINDLIEGLNTVDEVHEWSFRQGVYAAEKHHGVRK